MSECEQLMRVGAYHDGELDSPAAAEMERHIQNCPACAEELSRLRRLSGLLAAAERPAPSASAMRRFHREADKASSAGLLHWAEALTAVAAVIVIAVSAWLWRAPKPSEPEALPLWETAAVQRPTENTPQTQEYQMASWVVHDLSTEGANGKN